jgi:hypothetical protein
VAIRPVYAVAASLVRHRSKTVDDGGFVRFAIHIRRHGYPKKFGRRTFVYFEIDGLMYWTMGSLKQPDVVINRTHIDKAAAKEAAVVSRTAKPAMPPAPSLFDGAS